MPKRVETKIRESSAKLAAKLVIAYKHNQAAKEAEGVWDAEWYVCRKKLRKAPHFAKYKNHLTGAIMRVKGRTSSAGDRYYVITHEGNTYEAHRKGMKWVCCGYVGTLKAIKGRIGRGVMGNPEIATEHDEEHSTGENLGGINSLYECVHPCAWLAVMMQFEEITPQMHETLDNYGWLTMDGKPDTDRAIREISIFKEASSESSKVEVSDEQATAE